MLKIIVPKNIVIECLLCLSLIGIIFLQGCASSNTPFNEDIDGYEFRRKEAANLNAQLALKYLSINQLAIAKEKVEKALLEYPSSPQVLNAAALVKIRLNNFDDAEQYFEDALELDSNNPDILNNYGAFLLRQRRDFDKAYEQFSLADRNPLYQSKEISSTNLANALFLKHQISGSEISNQDFLRLQGFIERAISFNKNYAPAYLSFSEILFYRNLFFEAKKYLISYHEIAAPNPLSLLHGIKIARKTNNNIDLKNYEKVLFTQFPNSILTRNYLQNLKKINKQSK